jgi:subtilisin family serine protease
MSAFVANQRHGGSFGTGRHRFILIPRVDGHSAGEMALATGSATAARQEIRRAFNSVRDTAEEQFRRLAIADVYKLRAGGMLQSRDPVEGCFRRLDGLAAYTVNVAKPALRSTVRDAIEENVNTDGVRFDVVEDFALGMPLPLSIDDADDDVGNPRQDGRWPEQCGVAAAHAMGVRGDGVLFGMLDTGADADHHELCGRPIMFRYLPLHFDHTPRDVRAFDVGGHGTHVAAIAAGCQVGVAPGARLHVGAVIESETMLTSASRVMWGLNWLVRLFDEQDNRPKPRVINLSLGFDHDLVRQDTKRGIRSELKVRMDALRALLDGAAVLGNAHVFAAIGNSGAGKAGYPALFDSVHGIGSVRFDGSVCDFSGSHGNGKPNFFGYGDGIRSAIARDYDGRSQYRNLSGTSMASPYAAAIASLYLSVNPRLSAQALSDVLTESGLPVAGQPGRLVRFDPAIAERVRHA